MFFTEHNRIFYSEPCCSVSGNGTVGMTFNGDYIYMKNYDHITAIVALGAVSSGGTIVVQKDADGSGTGTAMAYNYTTLACGDNAVGTTSAAPSSGYTVDATNTDNKMVIAEIDAAEIGESYPYVRISYNCCADTAGVDEATIFYILSRGRYTGAAVA